MERETQANSVTESGNSIMAPSKPHPPTSLEVMAPGTTQETLSSASTAQSIRSDVPDSGLEEQQSIQPVVIIEGSAGEESEHLEASGSTNYSSSTVYGSRPAVETLATPHREAASYPRKRNVDECKTPVTHPTITDAPKKTETVEDKASPEEKRVNQSSTPPNIASQKASQNESGNMGGPAYRVDEGEKLEPRVASDRQSASPNTPATKGLQSKAQDHPTNPGRAASNCNTGQMKNNSSKPSH